MGKNRTLLTNEDRKPCLGVLTMQGHAAPRSARGAWALAAQILSDCDPLASVRPTLNFHFTLPLGNSECDEDTAAPLIELWAPTQSPKAVVGHGPNSECSLFQMGQYQTTFWLHSKLGGRI
jgi:hypothetical protein